MGAVRGGWRYRLALGLLCGLLPFFPAPARAATPPNIIVVVLDDLGLHDLGATGNDFVETPAIDRLAREGIHFTQAYASAPNCAPSRAGLLTGQAAPRTGVYTMLSGDVGDSARRRVQTPKNQAFLPEAAVTLAELLRDHGYATAHIGKWNLGTGPVRGPTGQGFQVNVGGYRGGDVGKSYFAPYDPQLPGLQQAPPGEYLTDRLSREAVQFVEQHRAQPFFLYLSHFAPHFPIQAPADTVQKYRHKQAQACTGQPQLRYCTQHALYPEYAAMVEHIDRGMAALDTALERLALRERTVIVLLSDNGGYALVQDPAALRGQKSQLYEGGLRVPMLWRVPGVAGGQQVREPVTALDVFPTLAALAGIDVAGLTLDGNNLAPLWQGGAWPARDLFWYFPGYALNGEGDTGMAVPVTVGDSGFQQVPAAVIRRGAWKLVSYYDGTPPELYDLAADPRETTNRYPAEPARAAPLQAALQQWLRATGGVEHLPRNPDYTGPSPLPAAHQVSPVGH